MEQIQLNRKLLRGSKVLSETSQATVLLLKDKSIIKIFNQDLLIPLKFLGIDKEAKILDAKPIENVSEILVPKKAVYTNKQFAGYITDCANGINFNEYDRKLTLDERRDLQKYAIVHRKIEDILVRADNIVFPDLLTCDNIFIDSDNNIQIIDYDGLQIGKHKTFDISTSLGNQDQYCIPKYISNETKLFTKELDKKSSILLYFLSTFNIQLSRVGVINPETNTPITLDDIFSLINLDDLDLCHKVWKLFQNNIPNEFLFDDVFRIAEKYDLEAQLEPTTNHYFKRLKKK